MNRRLLLLIAVLCPLATAGTAQESKAHTVPVTCKEPQDKPNPPRTPGPHDQKPGTTAVDADAIVEAGRQHKGFLSAPEPENFGILRYQLMEYANCAAPGLRRRMS